MLKAKLAKSESLEKQLLDDACLIVASLPWTNEICQDQWLLEQPKSALLPQKRLHL